MAREGKFSPLFQRMLEAPDAAIAALRADPAAYEDTVLTAEGGEHVAQATMPYRASLSFALFDTRGQSIPCDGHPEIPQFDTLDDLREHIDSRSGDGRLLCVARDGDQPLFGLWAPYAETVNWNLPEGVRQTARTHGADAVALFATGVATQVEDAASAFGLPPFQQRVVGAVTRIGSLKTAAQSLGISYAAAREAMGAAARRLQLPNTPAVVRAVVAAAFGVLPKDVDSSLVLVDALNITARQAQVALLIAGGASREETARALGTSTAVVRKEMNLLFDSLGVTSAAELARLITEMQALRLFARSIDNAPGFLNPAIEPSRFSIRPNDRGIIGWSDYGPASGKPVLVVHSNWCCRAVPVPLVRALQARGWRPIAIDRPGFGVSHIGRSTRQDPYTQAIDDTLQILGELKIAAIPVVARCGAQFVHALATREPERVGPTVLVAPTPQADDKGKRFGPAGAFKEAFYRSPRLIELFYRVISAQFTFERVEQLMRSLTRGSPVDEALCDDPQFIRDRFRALRPFTCGGYLGGIHEEMIISQGGWSFAALDRPDWTILQGGIDYHNDPGEVASYWRELLPTARYEVVPDGGRFMTSSHPALIVDRLEEARGRAAVR